MKKKKKKEFNTVCCDPHSQIISCSQWSRSKCFTETVFWNSFIFIIIPYTSCVYLEVSWCMLRFKREKGKE